jgi:hypothetical protein
MIRNPVYILGLFLAFVLSYAVWLQYDITAYFRNGNVRICTPLLTYISSRVLPWYYAESKLFLPSSFSSIFIIQLESIAFIPFHFYLNFQLPCCHLQVSGLLTISSSLLPTIMEIVTAIVNMTHKKKHSSHMSRAGPHHAQSFSNQTRKHAQVHYHASPDSASSSSSVDSNSDNESWSRYHKRLMEEPLQYSGGELCCYTMTWCAYQQ